MFSLLKYGNYGDGKYIDIAKGKYKLPLTLKEGIKQLKRQLKRNPDDKKSS